MLMLDTFPGDSYVCLVFAARILCNAFADQDYRAGGSLALPGGNVFWVFFRAYATELICSSNMETSVINRSEVSDWILHLTGADTHQKPRKNVKNLVLFQKKKQITLDKL